MGARWKLGIAAVLAVAFAAGVILWRSQARPSHIATPVTNPATTRPAVPMLSEITLAGVVEPRQVTSVAVPVDGIIDQFMADAGQHVSAGEVLARIRNPRLADAQQAAQLDAEQTRNHLSQLESGLIAARLEVSRCDADATRIKLALDQAAKTFEHQQIMFREGVTPRLTFEKAQQEYNSLKTEWQLLADASRKAAQRVESITNELGPARKAVAQKTNELEDARAESEVGDVNSPVDGMVIARSGKAGEPVNPAMSDLFQIAEDPVVLQVVASIDPREAARIHSGQPVVIEAGLPGTVRETKSGQVFVDFSSAPPDIKPGTTVQIKIELR